MTGVELERALDRRRLTPLQVARMAGSTHLKTVYGAGRVGGRPTRDIPPVIAALVAFLTLVPRTEWPIDCPRKTKVSGPRRVRSTHDPLHLVVNNLREAAP